MGEWGKQKAERKKEKGKRRKKKGKIRKEKEKGERENPPTQSKARRILLLRDKKEKGRLGTRNKNQFVKFV